MPQYDARLGEALASGGDVSGDGLSAFVVGLPGFDEGESEEGVARLWCGSPGGPVRIFSWAPRGEQTNANLGAAFAGPADFEGDGFCDIVAGAPGARAWRRHRRTSRTRSGSR